MNGAQDEARKPPLLVFRSEAGLRLRAPLFHYKIYLIDYGYLRASAPSDAKITGPCIATVPIGIRALGNCAVEGSLISFDRSVGHAVLSQPDLEEP